MEQTKPLLTVERLFDSPPLTGNLPTGIKFAPDGSCLGYLKPAADDRERLDLWRFDLATGTHRCWLNARELINSGTVETDAEKAERERRRLFSRGITDYHFSPSVEALLIPLDGAGYLFDIASGTLRQFTAPQSRQTDFRFSPKGTYVSYVRNGDLYYLELASGDEQRVTTDGGGTIANGIADFIAAEEMHRFDGHWWAADESKIAFTRTDESTVEVSRRLEIDAEAFNVIEQRYPYAGAVNADVALKLHILASGGEISLDWRHEAGDYLARVDWDGDRLIVQVQSRDQRSLYLDAYPPDTGSRSTLIEESADTWINLHDNFTPVDGERFLWTSEREGNARLYLYADGEAHELTGPTGRVNKILHADQEAVIFTGWQENPTEQHIFSARLDGTGTRQLSVEAGWHEAVISADGQRVLDRSSSLTDMGRVTIFSVGGSDTPVEVAAERPEGDHPYAPYLWAHRAPRLGALRADDGQTLHYRLTEPAVLRGQHPLIVFVYGGPGVHRVKNENPPLLLQLFASRGFGVLELDNRGSSNRNRRFETAIYRCLGDVEVRDQAVGARFAQSLDWVDADRIGMFGHSYGGYMTLMCLAKAADVFSAGVAVAPVSEWQLYDTHYTERYLGTPEQNPQGYADSAVFPYLDQLQGRLLIIHGMADDNVLFTHSTKLFKALQNRLFPFEMMTYPGSKHALQEQNVSIHRFNLILDFFDRALAP